MIATNLALDSAPTPTAPNRSNDMRALDGIYSAPPVHWVGDGFRVSGYFNGIPNAVQKLSPFLLLDYHPSYDYAPSKKPRGVGVHPHRGFETVTIAWQGSVAHHDSAGGGGTIGPGDAQWMTAASGILHKEYHEQNYARQGGPFRMAQLWVNLPSAHKMSPPRYQALLAGEMGVATLPHAAGSVRVIAGEYEGVRGPAQTFSAISVFDARLNAKGAADFRFPESYNAGLLVMKGAVTINGTAANLHDFLVFAHAGERVHIEATDDSELLILSGQPIDEPVVQYGPFVMNSEREILQAFADYESGKFGQLED